MARTTATQIRDLVLDPGTYVSWDDPPVPTRHSQRSESYRADLARAAEKSGSDEAVLTGEGLIEGRRVAIIAGEFDFLAGSIGIAAAERIVTALERATAERLPVLASPTSGGTRMQEGTVAFLQMVKITAAVAAHRATRQPYLVYLRHPTTGGVFASWGSLGHVAIAEPNALIGFLGPRVYEALYGAEFPEDVQVSENLARNGMIDGVAPPEDVRALTASALRVLCQDPPSERELAATHPVSPPQSSPPPSSPPPDTLHDDDPPTAWDSVTRSRDRRRPGARAVLAYAATDRVRLSGTGQGESSGSVQLTLARFRGRSAVVLAQDRAAELEQMPLGPSALRSARRGMRIAAELGVPLLVLIDTRGAALSKEAEEGGLAGEIARCLSDLVSLRTPTVSVLLGQGTGGAAIAMLPADRVLSARHGWLAPLPPEGASAILYRTTERAPEVAASQGITAWDLREAGIVDDIVPEYPDAADEPEAFCDRLGDAIATALDEVTSLPPDRRYADRLARYRNLGLGLE